MELSKRLYIAKGISPELSNLEKRLSISNFALYRFFPKIFFYFAFWLNLCPFVLILTANSIEEKVRYVEWSNSSILLVISVIVYVNCIFSWLYFVYRSNSIANTLHPEIKIVLSPWKAIGWFFVPIVNLIKPLTNTLRVWKKSGGTRSSMMFYLWWAMFLMFIVGAPLVVILIKSIASRTGNEILSLNLYALLHGFVALSIYFAIRVITKVCDLQKYGSLDYD